MWDKTEVGVAGWREVLFPDVDVARAGCFKLVPDGVAIGLSVGTLFEGFV